MSGLDLLGVVVPARDEAQLLPACLAALAAAAKHPDLADTPVLVVVVADSCTDDTADLALAGGARLVITDAGAVGAARHAGALAVLREAAATGVADDRVWLASTDADSRVPTDWLALHRASAHSGIDAVLGLVEVRDWAGHPAHAPAAFAADYHAWRAGGPEAVHPHVHGANLGVRGSAYAAAGGFPPWPVTEDHGLVRALLLGGRTVLRTPLCPVVTSARRTPRAHGGFGTDLDRLAADPQPD